MKQSITAILLGPENCVAAVLTFEAERSEYPGGAAASELEKHLTGTKRAFIDEHGRKHILNMPNCTSNFFYEQHKFMPWLTDWLVTDRPALLGHHTITNSGLWNGEWSLYAESR